MNRFTLGVLLSLGALVLLTAEPAQAQPRGQPPPSVPPYNPSSSYQPYLNLLYRQGNNVYNYPLNYTPARVQNRQRIDELQNQITYNQQAIQDLFTRPPDQQQQQGRPNNGLPSQRRAGLPPTGHRWGYQTQGGYYQVNGQLSGGGGRTQGGGGGGGGASGRTQGGGGGSSSGQSGSNFQPRQTFQPSQTTAPSTQNYPGYLLPYEIESRRY